MKNLLIIAVSISLYSCNARMPEEQKRIHLTGYDESGHKVSVTLVLFFDTASGRYPNPSIADFQDYHEETP